MIQQVYLPALACHERQHWDRLADVARQHGGLIIGLDGLAPEGGEPQLWFIRELLTGLTLRSGWLSRFDQTTFEAFLQPLAKLAWPTLAVLSDKQKGLPEAVATVLPAARHQFCQGHYLKNLAEPLAEADSTFNVTLRKAVRAEVGLLIRTENPAPTPQAAASVDTAGDVLTVTGLYPYPLPPSTAQPSPAPRASADPEGAEADVVVNHLLRHTRYLLTLKGRPPFRLAGIETYARLQGVVALSQELLAQRPDPRLADLSRGLQTALAPLATAYDELQQGATWLGDIDRILATREAPSATGPQVAQKLRTYLDKRVALPDLAPHLVAFRTHLDKVTTSYWPGLFHCYDLPALPRTNNALESHFRDTQRRLLRTTGQKGQMRRALQRLGAWELLPRPPTETQCLAALRKIPRAQLALEQDRLRQHQQRFRLHVRSIRRINAQFDKLRAQWRALPTSSTG